MKNPARGKRRGRRTGVSPYKKYGKTPFRYSAHYYDWRARTMRKAGRENVDARRPAA